MKIARFLIDSRQTPGKFSSLFFFLSLNPWRALAVSALILASLGPATVSAAPKYYVSVTTSAESGGVWDSDGDSQTDSTPVTVTANNNYQNPKARGFASAAAGPGYVAVISNSQASGYAPTSDNTTSVGYNNAYFIVDDLIFTGPNATVNSNLKLLWSGIMDYSVDSLTANTYTNSNTTLDITGYIRRPASTTFLSFSGYRGVSKEQDGLNPQSTSMGESGIIAGAYPPSGPLVTAQFNVPTGEYLEFKLSIATFSGTALMWTLSPGPCEGSAISKADFGSTLHLPTSGPVFNLPAGYNANSVDAGIVDNEWTGTPLSAPSPDPNYCGDLGTVFLDADLSQDCYVALHDFGLFNLQWQETDCNSTTWCNGADIDKNTVVGLPDLKLFFTQWLWCTGPFDPSCDIYW